MNPFQGASLEAIQMGREDRGWKSEVRGQKAGRTVTGYKLRVEDENKEYTEPEH